MSDGLNETLRLRVPKKLMVELDRHARAQYLTVSAYVRLILAEHVGLIEPPSVLVDSRAVYEAGLSDD